MKKHLVRNYWCNLESVNFSLHMLPREELKGKSKIKIFPFFFKEERRPGQNLFSHYLIVVLKKSLVWYLQK